MSRYVICDNCGEKDDWGQSGTPFFPDGLLLQFRGSHGSPEFTADLEICCGCRQTLLDAFPKLAEALKERA